MPRGRKRIIQITPEVFQGMCAAQCTEVEIARILGASVDTLRRWVRRTYKANFATVYANHAEVGKLSLRRAQMKCAVEQLNPAMLKWMGQQYLGQRDKQDIDVKITDEREVVTSAAEQWLETMRRVQPNQEWTLADAVTALDGQPGFENMRDVLDVKTVQ